MNNDKQPGSDGLDSTEEVLSLFNFDQNAIQQVGNPAQVPEAQAQQDEAPQDQAPQDEAPQDEALQDQVPQDQVPVPPQPAAHASVLGLGISMSEDQVPQDQVQEAPQLAAHASVSGLGIAGSEEVPNQNPNQNAHFAAYALPRNCMGFSFYPIDVASNEAHRIAVAQITQFYGGPHAINQQPRASPSLTSAQQLQQQLQLSQPQQQRPHPPQLQQIMQQQAAQAHARMLQQRPVQAQMRMWLQPQVRRQLRPQVMMPPEGQGLIPPSRPSHQQAHQLAVAGEGADVAPDVANQDAVGRPGNDAAGGGGGDASGQGPARNELGTILFSPELVSLSSPYNKQKLASSSFGQSQTSINPA